jgi:hypothetical protein
MGDRHEQGMLRARHPRLDRRVGLELSDPSGDDAEHPDLVPGSHVEVGDGSPGEPCGTGLVSGGKRRPDEQVESARRQVAEPASLSRTARPARSSLATVWPPRSAACVQLASSVAK